MHPQIMTQRLRNMAEPREILALIFQIYETF